MSSPILVVGSVALDRVRTPFGEADEALGGSATYFSYSASFFAPVRLVGVVGEDFSNQHLSLLRGRPIALEGLEVRPGKTFRWSGSYEKEMNEAKTLGTDLNVFETFQPKIPAAFQDTPYVFLANIDPDLQLEVLRQIRAPKLVGCDTMNLWINIKRDSLLKLLGKVDLFVLNEGEARLLTERSNLIKAGRMILAWGPKRVVIKKGEHGAILFSPDSIFAAPAYPTEKVFDPTGAGDCFAGGLFGSLAQSGDGLSDAALRRAVIFGSVMASFNVEQFSLQRLTTLTPAEIQERFQSFQKLIQF